MIYIDRREGSKDLIDILPPGLASLTTLPYTDACWQGIGPGGGGVLVGVERKRVLDLLACLKDGRFTGHQLVGMLSMCSHVYLLIEGMVRPDPNTGILQEWSERRRGWVNVRTGATEWTYDAWEHHLETLRRKTPLEVVVATSPNHTARLITSLYTWWTVGGGWDSHKSHSSIHIPPDPFVRLVQEPTYRRTVTKMAQQLPGVRGVLAARVHDKFHTVRDMVQACPADWETVDGIGSNKALAVWGAIHGPVPGGRG